MRNIRGRNPNGRPEAVAKAKRAHTRGDSGLLHAFLGLLDGIPERDPATFFAFREEVVSEIFAKPETSCVLVSCGDGGEPIAGGFIWQPTEADSSSVKTEHEGLDVGLAPGNYLQIDNTIVLPGFRGKGLQRNVVRKLLEGADLPVVATVSPVNKASLNNLERCGFEVRRTIERHGGHMRHAMLYCPLGRRGAE